MDPQVFQQQVPSDIAHTMIAASAMGAAIRGLVGILKTPLFREAWLQLPWWAKPTMLLVLTGIAFMTDALVFGQPWYLALGSALTGLGSAVVTHEWQAMFKRAREDKKQRRESASGDGDNDSPTLP